MAFPACRDCGTPVTLWLGAPDSREARCTTCWDRVYADEARARDRAAYVVVGLFAAALFILALWPR